MRMTEEELFTELFCKSDGSVQEILSNEAILEYWEENLQRCETMREQSTAKISLLRAELARLDQKNGKYRNKVLAKFTNRTLYAKIKNELREEELYFDTAGYAREICAKIYQQQLREFWLDAPKKSKTTTKTDSNTNEESSSVVPTVAEPQPPVDDVTCDTKVEKEDTDADLDASSVECEDSDNNDDQDDEEEEVYFADDSTHSSNDVSSVIMDVDVTTVKVVVDEDVVDETGMNNKLSMIDAPIHDVDDEDEVYLADVSTDNIDISSSLTMDVDIPVVDFQQDENELSKEVISSKDARMESIVCETHETATNEASVVVENSKTDDSSRVIPNCKEASNDDVSLAAQLSYDVQKQEKTLTRAPIADIIYCLFYC